MEFDRRPERATRLETEYGTLIGLLGDNFHSAVVRMAVQIERMAMILSALRAGEELSVFSDQYSDELKPESDSELMNEKILCTDEDYETAEMIGNKMLLHMAAAYRMIDGDAQDVVPEIKPLDQRKVLFEQLKPEYKLQELITEAKSQGISRATVIRWNDAETLRLFETSICTYHAGFKAIAQRVSESHSLTAKFCRIPFDLIDDVCRIQSDQMDKTRVLAEVRERCKLVRERLGRR